MPYLFISKKLYAGIWKYAKESSRMATKESYCSILAVNSSQGSRESEPGARVFRILRIGRLEENLDSVKRSDCGFGLCKIRLLLLGDWE
jgi:hypothetical protein